jgi:hypothetical protein
LLCRFDYREKAWNLPPFVLRRDPLSPSLVDSAALASALQKINRSNYEKPKHDETTS